MIGLPRTAAQIIQELVESYPGKITDARHKYWHILLKGEIEEHNNLLDKLAQPVKEYSINETPHGGTYMLVVSREILKDDKARAYLDKLSAWGTSTKNTKNIAAWEFCSTLPKAFVLRALAGFVENEDIEW